MTDRVETAGRRVERFAEVSLSVWEMRHSYEDRMKVVSVPILIHPQIHTSTLKYFLQYYTSFPPGHPLKSPS